MPALDEDDRPLVGVLGGLGVEAAPAVWDEPRVDWSRFDLVVLRSTWDYAERHGAFLEWARALPHVLNPVSVLEWSVDKHRYLVDLDRVGVPIVGTTFLEPGTAFDAPAAPFVVKPAISAGGRMSARFEPHEHGAANALVARIHDAGRTAMVQPFLDGVDELSLVYIAGNYSHALRRRAPLPAGREQPVFYLDEELSPATASNEEIALATRALALAPDRLLYGRVDLIGGAVLEVEAVEPSLYLSFGEGALERLARAIAAAVI